MLRAKGLQPEPVGDQAGWRLEISGYELLPVHTGSVAAAAQPMPENLIAARAILSVPRPGYLGALSVLEKSKSN